jgi:hypothetical protein
LPAFRSPQKEKPIAVSAMVISRTSRRNEMAGRVFEGAAPRLEARRVITGVVVMFCGRRCKVVARLPVSSALYAGVLLIVALSPGPGFAERLVDPNSVAPEFREVAEKRRAEQIKLFDCSRKADEAKVLRRDRAAFVGQCLGK